MPGVAEVLLMSIDLRFIDCLFEPNDLVEVRLLPRPSAMFLCAKRLAELNDKLGKANATGRNIYVGANPRSRRGGKAKDVALARSLFVDLDNINVEETLVLIAAASLPTPTCFLDSGHGTHAYWRLAEPLTDLKAWTVHQKSLIRLLDSDASIHDPPRIMRLPGFTNHKAPARNCSVIDADPSRRYYLRELVPAAVDRVGHANSWYHRALQRATPGNRNKTGFWLACQLRDIGMDQHDSEKYLRDYADCQDPDYTEEEAVASVRSAYTKAARTPARMLVDDVSPDPPVISLESSGLPEIPPDALPSFAREFAIAISEAKEVPSAMATLLTLSVTASCVQRKYMVQVESSYAEPLCLYVAPALESGERKTAVHGPVIAPLVAFQKQLREEARFERQAAVVKQRLIEQEIKTLEKDYVRADENERHEIETRIVTLTRKLPEKMGTPQCIVEDFTEAALSVALAENGESLLVASDEGGLFDNLSGRHNDISEIDLFLKSHMGSPHTVNRVGRDNLFLERPLLSVAISPQPDVLAKLARKEGFLGRGLTARFLWALPRSKVGTRKLVPAAVPSTVVAAYHEGIVSLAREGVEHLGEPILLRLTPEAYACWKSLEHEIEPRIGPNGDLRQIKPWASKLPGAVIRIAGVCHTGTYGTRSAGVPISEDQMRRAVALGKSLIPHSIAAHRLMGGGGMAIAQEVVQHYVAVGWPTKVRTLTEWWRPVRQLVGNTSSDFEPVAQILVDHGYLIPEQATGAGRWGKHFRANGRLSQVMRIVVETAA